jgi:hypothetical protein
MNEPSLQITWNWWSDQNINQFSGQVQLVKTFELQPCEMFEYRLLLCIGLIISTPYITLFKVRGLIVVISMWIKADEYIFTSSTKIGQHPLTRVKAVYRISCQ